MSCQSGSLINELNEFALQNEAASVDDNICPAVGDENTPILLNALQDKCDFRSFESTFKAKVQTLFEEQCVGKTNCTINIPKGEWPAEC